jgi:hypothetical protein
MVMGLVIHTNAIATGKLTEKIIALGAANNIWNGTGIKALNKPIGKALEIACDEFTEQGTQAELYQQYGLTTRGIINATKI